MAKINTYMVNRSETEGSLQYYRDAYNVVAGGAEPDVNKAAVLREKIEEAVVSLPDEDALEAVELFPHWSEDGIEYVADDRVLYEGTLFKCLQTHTSQAAWTPTAAVSLWARVLIPDPDVIPDWEQPDSTNAYMKGDKVRYNGKIYESLIDNNVWSPEAYPAGWSEVI